ncbi:MAG: OmpA family protein [Nitrospira sp.]|nr:OmpA family protein [Nitrospira sp.]
MQQNASPVSSGNITPKIGGSERDKKEVLALGAVVLILGGLLAAMWLYSQTSNQVNPTAAAEQFEHTRASDLFTKSTAMNQAETSTTNSTKMVTPDPSISDIIHTDIYFEVGRKGLSDEGKAQLATQAAMLKQHEDYGVLIQGYTDQQGSASYNMQLGLKRAETVKAELVNAGIAEHRIKTMSLGEEGVLCVDSSDVCRHMNRRVHLEVRKIGQEHMVLPSAQTTPSNSPETTIDSSSTMGEDGTTGESLPPSWSEPALIPKPTKGR